MPSTRRVIRAFLASPGDLEEERRAIRRVVEEFNNLWADELGYQVDLVGWEETVAGYGRPQHLINQDVDSCELFIGMIWKRWGTPPGGDGGFSSGFEEEYTRSLERRERTGSPQVSLFFKAIPDEFMADPGEDLKRVLQFQETVKAERKILFQNFSTVSDMEERARQCVTEVVKHVKKAEASSESDEARARRPQPESGETQNDERTGASPLSEEGFTFLEDLVKRLGHEEAVTHLSGSEIARFRLLANSISKPGNDELDLGVHDLNILFSGQAEDMNLGPREVHCLTRLGFQYFSDENVPFWTWYSRMADSPFDIAFVSSAVGTNDDVKVGAIRVLTALQRTFPEDADRERILDAWFSAESSTQVRSAALDYLAQNGLLADLAVARKEYDRNDHETSQTALECMVQILLRTGPETAAQELILETQFVSFDGNILTDVLDGFDDLETGLLLLGLEHRNVQVRLRALRVLRVRGSMEREQAERLTKDSDALVRYEAIGTLSKLGHVFNEDEVKEILAPRRSYGLFGMLGADVRGTELFVRYQSESLRALSSAELTNKADLSFIGDDMAYFVRAEVHFAKYGDELRRDVDDKFKAYFDERIRRMDGALGHVPAGKDVIKKAKEDEDTCRRNLTRQGLDVLCRAGQRMDLDRVRDNLESGYAGRSTADAEYLQTKGEWIDIPLLANGEGPKRGESLLTWVDDDDFTERVAKAVVAMARGYPLSRLVGLEMPPVILKKAILSCTERGFAGISDTALLKLFDHDVEDVRKAAVIMAVRMLSKERIRSILRKYRDDTKEHYYNVVHWLDLGVSMSRDEAQRVAREAMK